MTCLANATQNDLLACSADANGPNVSDKSST